MVDSSVLLYRLPVDLYHVTGVFMKNWDSLDEKVVCSSERDEDAYKVCQNLDIPFLTPNPDILCNKHIKFNHFYNYAINCLGADAMATGHCARTSQEDEDDFMWLLPLNMLYHGADCFKDQTFFLSQMLQDALRHTVFPLSGLTKVYVKKIAAEAGFQHVLKKKEVTNHTDRQIHCPLYYLEPKPSTALPMVNLYINDWFSSSSSLPLRLGWLARIGGQRDAWFVVDKDITTGEVFVGPTTNHPALFRDEVRTDRFHWITEDPPTELIQTKMECHFPPCTVTLNMDGSVWLMLSQPIRALTPGQFTVLYKGDECLGTGKIVHLGPTEHTLQQGRDRMKEAPVAKERTPEPAS
uniref:tRNA 5-methylaminomethyl-2-thiouridylate methyltransferase n=1 Tax=Salmo trutta TaxID=8032 RepID=A0A674E1H3_SALTR